MTSGRGSNPLLLLGTKAKTSVLNHSAMGFHKNESSWQMALHPIVELPSALLNIVSGIHYHDSPTLVSWFDGDVMVFSQLSKSSFLLVAEIRDNPKDEKDGLLMRGVVILIVHVLVPAVLVVSGVPVGRWSRDGWGEVEINVVRSATGPSSPTMLESRWVGLRVSSECLGVSSEWSEKVARGLVTKAILYLPPAQSQLLSILLPYAPSS
ncbi:hypothetical protein EGW08_003723 [Elysia chlorotica]|uniref:Uncharacterized protein n=1 Tax=Elysia chlorotica TaxID=188477 RepID=A0A3S1ACS4_ELYCH|nr:hypothetical protein EGW08_003723 [Elysia chlorotica]